MSGHSRASVFDVVGVCANGMTKANGGHDEAVEIQNGCLRVNDDDLANCCGDLVHVRDHH